MTSIAIIIPWFGTWPQWVDLFFYSCRCNDTIDFFLFTDQKVPKSIEDTKNIHIYYVSFDNYCELVHQRLDVDFHPQRSYKLCDLKPYYGLLHKDLLVEYDFWGFGDIDLVWGNIRKFYTDELLQRYDILSTHADRLSGHLTLIRNTKHYSELPLSIPNWKSMLASPNNYAIDEIAFSRKIYPLVPLMWKIHRHVFFRFHFRDEWASYNQFCKLFNKLFKPPKIYFYEQHTTPWFSESEAKRPEVISLSRWHYTNGNIIDLQTNREIIYLHFVCLKKRWGNNFYTAHNKYDNVEISLKGIN